MFASRQKDDIVWSKLRMNEGDRTKKRGKTFEGTLDGAIAPSRTAATCRAWRSNKPAAALETLKGRAPVKRTMWSRRAQEYEAKINSGDIVATAEVAIAKKFKARQKCRAFCEPPNA